MEVSIKSKSPLLLAFSVVKCVSMSNLADNCCLSWWHQHVMNICVWSSPDDPVMDLFPDRGMHTCEVLSHYFLFTTSFSESDLRNGRGTETERGEA